MLRQFVGLMLFAIWPAVVCGDGPTFDALARDGRQSRGILTGDLSNGFRFQSSAMGTISLDAILSLELSQVTRSLPDREWKRLALINGDVLHAKLKVAQTGDPHRPIQSLPSDWFTNFAGSVKVPLEALAEISHPPGTLTTLYQDFETDAAGWLNREKGEISLDRKYARSGSHSLKAGPAEPLWYDLPVPLEKGWLEFSFFLEGGLKAPEKCVATLQITDGPTHHDLQVTLSGDTAWYDVKFPALGTWQRQIVACRSGWHTVIVAVQSGLFRLSMDDFPLTEGKFPATASPKLTGLKLTSTAGSHAVWIDDFAITQAIPESRLDILDRNRDQIDLVSGDQLFGKVIGLQSRSITLQATHQQTDLKWPEIVRLHLATRPGLPRSVTGRQVQIDLQPWSNLSQDAPHDSLSGALVAINPESCTLDHPLCGQISIPWQHIRRLKPAFFGTRWLLEGQPYHLGDEVKSTWQTRIPDGTQLRRTIDIPQIPEGPVYISLTAVDLEPAGMGTLDHPWLKRLQAGELTSELCVNSRRIRVLNADVTGRGTTNQPQRVRIRVPSESLVIGKNQIEIHLQPSRGEPVEYDDWELRDWQFEIETKP